MKGILSIATLPIATSLPCDPRPGELSYILQQISVVLKLVQTMTGRVLGEAEGAPGVQVTANSPGYKLQHTFCEAELMIVLARPSWRVQSSPLNQGELSHSESLFSEINPLCLTKSAHVPTGPELSLLMDEDIVTLISSESRPDHEVDPAQKTGV